MVQKRLGRGLASLLSDSRTEGTSGSTQKTLRIDEISPNPSQPRKVIDATGLDELKSSIKTHGLLQPLIVRPKAEGGYLLIAGERRWRACRELNLENVPVVIREEEDKEALELALIENIQRENLNPIEEAKAYAVLHNTHGLTHEEIAERVGKSRPTISNRIRLLDLEPDIREALSNGGLTAGHAKALLAIKDPKKRREAFESVLKGEIHSVRDVEDQADPAKSSKKKAGRQVAPEIRDLENQLSDRFQARVRIQDRGNRGKVIIEYRNLDDFDRLLQIIRDNR